MSEMSFVILAIISLAVLLLIGVVFWVGFLITSVKGERKKAEEEDPPVHKRVS